MVYLRSEDLGGAGTRLEDRSLEKTSIVCYLMMEDLGGVGARLRYIYEEFDKDKLALFVT